MNLEDLKIGDFVWVFHENRRIYAEGGHGGPIWREHWVLEKIASQTSRSWIFDFGMKIPKKGPTPPGILLSRSELDDACYVKENTYRISELVRSVRSANVLRKIELLINQETT